MAKTKSLFGGQCAASVSVELRIEDVLALRPGWDSAGAEYFLKTCDAHLAAAMLKSGTEELERLIQVAERLAADEGENCGE